MPFRPSVTAGGAYNTTNVEEIFVCLSNVMRIASLIGQKLNTSQICGLLAAFLILLTGLLISSLTYTHLETQLSAKLRQDAQRQLQRLTVALAPSLLRQDRISISLTLSDWSKGPEIDAIRVLNASQQVIAESGRPSPDSIEISQPVTQDNLSIGLLRADINLSSAEQTARRYFALGLIASALAALLAALVVYQLSERYLHYLRQLQQRLSNWQEGKDLLHLPPPPLLSDLKQLHSTLNNIAIKEQQQRAMQEALGRFISAPPATGELLRYHECALLFIEIQDLEILQNRLSAEQLSKTLNQYHRLLSHAAKLYNGKLDRYLGDGVVMLFGMSRDPQSGHGNEALHCLYAAQLFLGLITHLRDHDSKTLPVEFRVAAHWGPVLMAPLSDDEQIQCSLIGDTVHWASHLATSGEERRLLVSQELLSHIPQDAGIAWEEGPMVSDLHGREQASYWLNSLAEKNQLLIQRQIKHITAMTENA